MQFVGNDRPIDIACKNRNCINFDTEAVVVIMILKFIVFYTILQVPYTREN